MNSQWPDAFGEIANAGFYVALRIGFAFPLEERNEFPEEWIQLYTRNGLMLRDPVVQWAYANTGAMRWSALKANDSADVLGKAAGFGLKFGAVISCGNTNSKDERSYGTFSRSDRELTDLEIHSITRSMILLHDLAIPPDNLTDAELEALEHVKEGLRLKEIAFRLGVSEGAIKQRLAGAKRKLGAKTSTHAASLAVMYRMI
jgi:LuxR family transcriptional regulator